MRVAKDQDLAMLINDRFEILEIHLVNVVYCFKRVVDNLTVHVFRNDAEGMVDRWLDNYFVTRFGEALQTKPIPFTMPGI